MPRTALDRFLEWCAIPSVSRDERAIADRIGAELADLGLDVDEDPRPEDGTAGNLLARVPATAPGTPILLCAHLDTVPQSDVIEPEVGEDGIVRNRAPAILGADNKAALASMITAVETIIGERRRH